MSLIVERFKKFVQVSLMVFSFIAGEAFRDERISCMDIGRSIKMGFRDRVLLAGSIGCCISNDGFGFTQVTES